jgi:hypothetical protein
MFCGRLGGTGMDEVEGCKAKHMGYRDVSPADIVSGSWLCELRTKEHARSDVFL